jgi:hypothetical protein
MYVNMKISLILSAGLAIGFFFLFFWYLYEKTDFVSEQTITAVFFIAAPCVIVALVYVLAKSKTPPDEK